VIASSRNHRATLRAYVQAVLREYTWLPGTPHKPSRQDRSLASSLHQQAVPLAVVRAALLLAAARRALRSPHLCPLPPIRTLHYFLPVIEEVLATPPDPGYVDYLAGKLHPLAQRKAEALSSQVSENFTS
jgi:hypothetical protein